MSYDKEYVWIVLKNWDYIQDVYGNPVDAKIDCKKLNQMDQHNTFTVKRFEVKNIIQIRSEHESINLRFGNSQGDTV